MTNTQNTIAFCDQDIELKKRNIFQEARGSKFNSVPKVKVAKTIFLNNNFLNKIEFCASEEAVIMDLRSKIQGIDVKIYDSLDAKNSLKKGVLLQTKLYYFSSSIDGVSSPKFQIDVRVKPLIQPDFVTTQTICKGAEVMHLPHLSPNGIEGNWLPEMINNQQSGIYVFTPLANQRALPLTLVVTVQTILKPSFKKHLIFEFASNVPTLELTSPNGITGIWTPSVINARESGTYLFKPHCSQCAETVLLTVTIIMP